MRKLILAALLPLALAGCVGLTSLPVGPSVVADATKLDEAGAIKAERAYKGWRVAMEALVDAGVLKGSLAARVADLDNRAYLLTQAARAAYRGGNATSYERATKEAEAAVTAALAAIGSK